MTDAVTSYSLKKNERLKSRLTIQKLFTQGASLFVFPLKLVYISVEDNKQTTDFLVGVTVPKRSHKKAHTRNLLKRRIREAYRKNKPTFAKQVDKPRRYALMYILVDQNITDYAQIEKSMIKLNKKLISKLCTAND